MFKNNSQGNIKTFRVILSGRVQGVGFRYFAEDRAFIYNIKGFVRNTRDGKVEVLCQGQKEDLDLFISEIKKGPAFAHVTRCEIEQINDAEIYDTFQIRF